MTRRIRIDDLTDLARPEQPALSPDGAHIVYVLRTSELGTDRSVRNLWTCGATWAATSEPARTSTSSSEAILR